MRRLVKAQPAEDRERSVRIRKNEDTRPNQFYLILIVILFETSGGLNG